MSNLYTNNLVSGIAAAMSDANLIQFPSEKVAFEVCADVASQLQGPEILPGPLDKASVELVGNMLKSAADELAARGMRPSAADAQLSKEASDLNIYDRAALMAEAYMAKVAGEGSLIEGGGNTLDQAAAHDPVADLDRRNRPTNKYNLGFGRTELPEAGIVGRQIHVAPKTSGSVLNNLDKQASERLDSVMDALRSAGASARMYGSDAAEALRNMSTPAKAAGALGVAGALGYGAYRGLSSEKEAHVKSAALFVQGLRAKFPKRASEIYDQVAGLALASHGRPGVMALADTLDAVKTASDADDAVAQILNHEGELGELATPELVAALQQILAEGDQGDQGDPSMGQGMPPGMPAGMPAGMPPKQAAAKVNDILARVKAAGDGNLLGESAENTLANAAKHDAVAALDQKNRPEGKYNKGPGKTDLPEVGQGATQKKAPQTESTVSNSLDAEKNAEAAYYAELEKVANQYAGSLPATFTREQKIAAIQHVMGLPPGARGSYIQSLQG